MNTERRPDVEFDQLCHDCQSTLSLDRPQFHGQRVFKGDIKTRRCDHCGDRL